MEWSPQQQDALAYVSDWFHNSSEQVAYIAGYAGTGKTTLAREFAKDIKAKARFAAYTGKAAMVMRKSGCNNASTIHSAMYDAVQDERGRFKFMIDEDGPFASGDLIVIDEVSMVGEDIGKDLLSFGKKILVLGDPAQLPPVKSGGFFTEREPDVMLTEIHRQAEGNPIIHLATQVRQGEWPEIGQYGDSKVIHTSDVDREELMAADQVLVGKNVSRHSYNQRMREIMGRESQFPEVGDRMVCLKNNATLGIFNGGIYSVYKPAKRQENLVKIAIKSEDFEQKAGMDVLVREEFFLGNAEKIPWQQLRGTEQFDYGYALTVHKAQGSQWDNVYLFNEAFGDAENRRRWLYTAITRAAKQITIVQGGSR